MNTYQEMPIPPPYNATINNETLPSSYYQQAKPLPTGNPMMIIASDYPVACDCPHCHHSIVTKVEKNNGLFAWLVASGLCLAGCCCGCCLIPFCIDDLKDIIHYCPNCNRIIGQHKKL